LYHISSHITSNSVSFTVSRFLTIISKFTMKTTSNSLTYKQCTLCLIDFILCKTFIVLYSSHISSHINSNIALFTVSRLLLIASKSTMKLTRGSLISWYIDIVRYVSLLLYYIRHSWSHTHATHIVPYCRHTYCSHISSHIISNNNSFTVARFYRLKGKSTTKTHILYISLIC
jgi:hypothetical protein